MEAKKARRRLAVRTLASHPDRVASRPVRALLYPSPLLPRRRPPRSGRLPHNKSLKLTRQKREPTWGLKA